MLVLLLLLLPVCFNRVLGKVLHEFQRFLDFQQHFVCLTAPHLGEQEEGEKEKLRTLEPPGLSIPIFHGVCVDDFSYLQAFIT